MELATATERELRVLADPTRARILALIADAPDGRRLVGAMAVELALTQPTVSHHVRVLLDDGILQRRPDGRRAWYSIVPDQVDRVAELLTGAPRAAAGDAVLERISADLSGRFAGTFGPETVERYVRESHALLDTEARASRYLPSLAAQFAADRLTALATQEHRLPDGAPEVLFVCVQNAGRSQLAAGILRHLAGDRVHVRTAGSAPVGAIRSVVAAALDEIGVPLTGEYPKPLTDEVVRAADYVITMGCGDACPIYPGRQYLDWEIEDPAGLPLGRVRGIRDDIELRVRALLASLPPTAG